MNDPHADTMTQNTLSAWASALGGIAALNNTHSVYIRSDVKAVGMQGTFEEWVTSDGRYRQHVDLGDVYRTLKIYDDTRKRGWIVDQNNQLRELKGGACKEPITEAFLGSFSHLAEGRMAGRVSEESSGDETEHILRIHPDNGLEVTYVLDSETHLPRRAMYPLEYLTRTVSFDDWVDVGGIKFPHRIREDSGAEGMTLEMEVREVRLNDAMADDLFEQPAVADRDFRFVTPPHATGIPIDLNWNHVFVKTQINDSEPGWMVLDTGAQVSVVDERIAARMGLERHGEFAGCGAGEGTAAAAFAKNVDFRLAGVELTGQTVAVIALAELFERFAGRSVNGVLGYDFISRFVVEIDYLHRAMSLFDPTWHTHPRGEVLPISLRHGIPTVRASLKPFGMAPIEADFVIDTGASDAVFLAKPFVEKHDLLSTLIENVLVPVSGVGGHSQQNVGRVEELTLGSHVFNNPLTFFAHDTRGAFASPNFAGIIGAEVLRRFVVTLDYPNQRIGLERNESIGEAFEFNRTGIVLETEGPDCSLFRVRALIDGSPAQEAGIEVGDVVTAVDGRAASEFDLAGLTRCFYEKRRSLTVGIKRGEELIEFRLPTRRLV